MSGTHIVRLRELLHKRVKVEVIDGRIITGYFVCIDKQGNLVLQNAVQSFADQSEERQMGMAIVPKQQRKSCHVEVFPHEREAMENLIGY